ncbi:MAG: FxsA family protein [Candidatus Thiodiazotropha sp.]
MTAADWINQRESCLQWWPGVSFPPMNPLLLFLLLFVGVPLVELYFLIQVGSQIGAFSTIFLTIFTALLGGWMVRAQGFATLTKVRATMDRGEVPAFEMLEGAVLLICGFLLLLPGFITDVVGFVFLVPPIRRWLLAVGLQQGGIMGPQEAAPHEPGERRVIEGEFKREDEKK